jgi:phasin family protein
MKTTPIRYEEAIAAAGSISKLSLEHFEKLVDLQFKAGRSFADLALANTREALEVKDLDGVKAYFEKQPELARNVFESIAKDSGAAIELGRGYAENMQSLLKKSAADVVAPLKAV